MGALSIESYTETEQTGATLDSRSRRSIPGRDGVEATALASDRRTPGGPATPRGPAARRAPDGPARSGLSPEGVNLRDAHRRSRRRRRQATIAAAPETANLAIVLIGDAARSRCRANADR
jgi:hypothetical protein